MIPDHCCARAKVGAKICGKIGAIKTSAASPAPDFQKAILTKGTPSP